MRLAIEPTRPDSRRSVVFAGGIIVAAAMLAYANSWTAPFVYDDTLAIPQNPTIRRLWPLTDVLLPPAEGGLTVSGRPILNLSFALNHAVSGTNVWSYHVANTLIHAGAGLLLFGIVRQTLRRLAVGGEDRAAGDTRRLPPDNLALAIAALWTVHPLQTQAVTYTVQRAESLMGLFYLLTLYAFIRACTCHPLAASMQSDPNSARQGDNYLVTVVGARLRAIFALKSRASSLLHLSRSGLDAKLHRFPSVTTDRCHPMDDKLAGRGGWLAVSMAACGLGMATKEVMVTAPLLVLLYDRTFVSGSLGAAWRTRRRYYFALAATWLLLGALVLSTGGNRGGTIGPGVGVPLWAYPLTQFEAVARYLALGVWPGPLVFEYGTCWVRQAGDVLVPAAVVLPLLAATVLALRHWPVAGFLGAWFFGILAPTSLAPGTIQMIVEHRMYLPLAAVIAGLGWMLHRAAGPQVLAPLALAGAGFLGLTVLRNLDYRSHLALWSDTVAKRPLNPRAHEGLAEALAEAGRLAEAIEQRREAVRLLPDESHYHFNLALTLAEAGHTEEAVRHYRLALSLQPDEPRTHNNLAILLARLGRNSEALPHYEEAVRRRPAEPLYHYNLGVALMREGRFSEAAASYQAALRLRADHADSHGNLATTLMRLHRAPEALDHYATARRLQPDDPDLAVSYGGALLVSGRLAEALAQFQGVLATRPDTVEAQYGAGNALAALRRPEAALAHYERTLQLDPRHANVRFKLGNTLLDLDRPAAAISHYEAALRLAPQDAEIHHNLGIAFARLERWDDARRAIDEALRLKPDYADAQRSRAQLRQVTGR